MTKENTEIVVSNKEIDLKVEAKKQLQIVAVNTIHSAKQPAKDFANCAIDYVWNRFTYWMYSKLSD